MLDLILAIASSTLIGLVFKFAEGRVDNRFTMLMGNYLIAVVISALVWLQEGASATISPLTVVVGGLAGAAFAGNFFLLMVSIKKRGVALPVILLRLAAIVPITAGMLFFAEIPDTLQILGLVGALIAAGLLSVTVRGGEFAALKTPQHSLRLVLVSLATLLCFGLSDLMLKLFDELHLPAEKPPFLVLLFGVAFAVFAVTLVIRRETPTLRDLGWGLLLGVPNMMSAYFMVSALEAYPAYIVFPVVSAGTVMAISLLAAILFRERLGRLGAIGILLTILSIVAINWNGAM